MARVIGIDHLVIRVRDFERSKAFYDTVLGFLGFKRKYTFGKTAGWSNGKTLYWIGEADARGQEAQAPHRQHRLPPLRLRARLAPRRRRPLRGAQAAQDQCRRPAGRLSRLRRGLLRRVLHRSRRPQARGHGLQAAAEEEARESKRGGGQRAGGQTPCRKLRAFHGACARRSDPRLAPLANRSAMLT